MARQTFKIGQKVAYRPDGIYRISQEWYPAYVEGETDGEINICGLAPGTYGAGETLSSPTIPNRRARIDGSLDRLSLVDHDALDKAIKDSEKEKRERSENNARRECEEADALERGWGELLTALRSTSNDPAKMRRILTPLVRRDSLQGFKATI